MRFRILYVSPTYPPILDGGAMFIHRLGKELKRLGHHVFVLPLHSVYEASLREEDYPWQDGCTVLPGLERWDFQQGIWHSRRAFQTALSIACPDIVHVIFPCSRIDHGYYAPLWAVLGRVPLVTTYFGLSLRKAAHFFNRFVSISLALRSHKIVSHDPLLLSFWKKFLPLKRSCVRFVPVGCNFDFHRNQYPSQPKLRRKLGLNSSGFYLSYFGGIDGTRGFDTILYSMAQLHNQNFPVRLLVIGHGGELLKGYYDGYPSRMRQLIRDLSLTEWVHPTGFLDEDEIAEYLLASDVCCLPFRHNVLGRTSLMAALQLGLPTITTLQGASLAQVNIEQNQGFCSVPADDVDALSRAILKLISDINLRESISQEAVELAKRFSWSNITERSLKVYHEVLS